MAAGARVKRGEAPRLVPVGSEGAVVVQGDLQIVSEETAIRGLVVGYSVRGDHVDHWMILLTKESGKSSYERVGVAIYTSDLSTDSSTDHAADLPFKSSEEEIILN